MKTKLLHLIILILCLVLAACTSESEGQAGAIVTDVSATQAAASTQTIVEPTITLPETTVPEPTPETVANDDLDAFIEQLQTAVINQDTAAMQAVMSDPIGVGPWLSEWSMLTPEQTAAQFRSRAIPAPMSVYFTDLTMDDITTLLNQPPTSMLGPDVHVVAALHSTGWEQGINSEAILFITEENGRYAWSAFLYTNGRFADMYLPSVPAPVGTIYSIYGEGYYQIQPDGSIRQLLDAETASIPNILISPDGRHAAYLTLDGNKLWLVDTATGLQEQLAADTNLSGFLMWGSNNILFTGVWLDPSEGDGPNNGHLATINIEKNGRPLQILDESRLSSGRPALASDGQTIAFDVNQSGPDNTEVVSRLYHPDHGVTVFDPSAFKANNDMINQARSLPTWSPDGRFMTWFSSAGDRVGMQLYDLETETAVQLFDWDPARFGALIPSPVWSPDGKWIALEVWANGPEGSGIWLIAADGSRVTLVDEQGQNPVWANAEQLVYNVNAGPHLYDLSREQVFKIDLPTGSWVWEVTPLPDLATLPGSIPVDETTFTFVLAAQDVPMYDGPDASYNQIGTIFDGQLAKVTGRSPDTGWWRVICPDDTVGNCWLPDDTAYTLATESAAPTSTLPDPAELPSRVSGISSPDGRWRVTVTQTDPIFINDFERFYVTLSVTDGTVAWAPIDEWRNYGLGYSWPTFHSWSSDSRYLYFGNMAQPDGCVVFMNGIDLYRLDTVDGTVKELIPASATASLTMTFDETAVAYTHWDGEKYQVIIRDIVDDSEKSVAITEAGQSAQAGDILWSPDNSQLFLSVVYDACLPNSTYSIIRVDLKTMTPTVLVDRSEEAFSIADWPNPEEASIRLIDANNQDWLLDINSGKLTAK